MIYPQLHWAMMDKHNNRHYLITGRQSARKPAKMSIILFLALSEDAYSWIFFVRIFAYLGKELLIRFSLISEQVGLEPNQMAVVDRVDDDDNTVAEWKKIYKSRLEII